MEWMRMEKAPASEGGRYKTEPKTTVRSDCATGTVRGNIFDLVTGRVAVKATASRRTPNRVRDLG